MKRYDPSLAEFSEQARLQLQPVVPEAGRSGDVRADRSTGAAERLFAIRDALLDAERARGEHASSPPLN